METTVATFSYLPILITLGVIGGLFFLIPLLLRRVVPTNEVHIVQSRKHTVSYGKDMADGNTYYEWPSFLPILGVTITKLPVSVFDLDLKGYEAYDKGRLPFVVDVKAFFRITDSGVAAQRIASFEEAKEQLQAIVQGAVRTILAKEEIEEIMQSRATFGEQFTKEVAAQLTSWGISTVKNIELMDIRDHQGSNVIRNIMEKKKSHIEMESRIEVAKNMQQATLAEIDARKTTDLQEQQAEQEVGQRKAQTLKEVGIAKQIAAQEVFEQEKTTKEKEMNVIRVSTIKTAEIEKEANIINAAQEKETGVIQAEGERQKNTIAAEGIKEQTILKAEGSLVAKQKESEGIKVEGEAKAAAESAMQLAPVTAQITLAKEIGENEGYQNYLQNIRGIEAHEKIGMEQAKALGTADLKVIANAGTVAEGVNKVTDILTPKGGTNLAGMLEALAQSGIGKDLLDKIVSPKKD